MKKIKILIADDEPDVLDVMGRKVQAAGYQVLTAQDGQEAWEKIQQQDPDIILLDLIMPKMDGYTVLEKLRQVSGKGNHPPVIIVSAQGELSDMRKGFSLEADHYITKPCRMEDVLKGLRLMVKLIPQRKEPGE